MKLVSILLKNIGLYEDGEILFPHDGETVTFVWGNNGAGKTTMLNAIRFGLLGSRALGSREAYLSFIDRHLISSRWDHKDGYAEVQLSFELVEDGEQKLYAIDRRFSYEKGALVEDVDVYCNGSLLEYRGAQRLLDKISTSLPRELLEVLIFDGEKATDIIQSGHLSGLIRNIVYSVYGLSAYENLYDDLSGALKKVKSSPSDSGDQVRFIELSGKKRAASAKYRAAQRIVDEQKRGLEEKRSAFSATAKQLSKMLGMEEKELSNIQGAFEKAAAEKKKYEEQAKIVVEEIIPLKLIEPSLLDFNKLIDENAPYQILSQIAALKKAFVGNRDYLQTLDRMESDVVSSGLPKRRLLISNDDSEEIKKELALLKGFSRSKILSFLEDRDPIYERFRSLAESSGRLKDDDVSSLLNDLGTISDEIKQGEEDLNSFVDDLKDAEAALNEVTISYQEVRDAVMGAKKSSNSFVQMTLYRDAVEEFIKERSASLVKSLSETLSEEIARIGFRNSSIAKAIISGGDFDLTLYEKTGREIPFDVFSAGEKQILLGLIIKSALRNARLDSFFLFDTPVGRLDQKNRFLFTKEVIMGISEQVVVFATNSDFNESDYKLIEERITDERYLKRDESDRIVLAEGSIYGRN